MKNFVHLLLTFDKIIMKKKTKTSHKKWERLYIHPYIFIKSPFWTLWMVHELDERVKVLPTVKSVKLQWKFNFIKIFDSKTIPEQRRAAAECQQQQQKHWANSVDNINNYHIGGHLPFSNAFPLHYVTFEFDFSNERRDGLDKWRYFCIRKLQTWNSEWPKRSSDEILWFSFNYINAILESHFCSSLFANVRICATEIVILKIDAKWKSK